MKNIQVIDGADNCVYDIFAVEPDVFSVIFPSDQDIAFVDEVIERIGESSYQKICEKLWVHRISKKEAQGIHGILFYELDFKKAYYPTRKDEEAKNPDGSRLRSC